MLCVVCSDREDGLPVYECKGCGIFVHEICYGFISADEDRKFTCAKCLKTSREIRCVLCVRKNGAFKPTVDKNWVHVVCALFTDGVVFEDVSLMEPVDTSRVKFNKKAKCTVCIEFKKDILAIQGYLLKCAFKDCNCFMHVTCAQRGDLLFGHTER